MTPNLRSTGKACHRLLDDNDPSASLGLRHSSYRRGSARRHKSSSRSFGRRQAAKVRRHRYGAKRGSATPSGPRVKTAPRRCFGTAALPRRLLAFEHIVQRGLPRLLLASSRAAERSRPISLQQRALYIDQSKMQLRRRQLVVRARIDGFSRPLMTSACFDRAQTRFEATARSHPSRAQTREAIRLPFYSDRSITLEHDDMQPS